MNRNKEIFENEYLKPMSIDIVEIKTIDEVCRVVFDYFWSKIPEDKDVRFFPNMEEGQDFVEMVEQLSTLYEMICTDADIEPLKLPELSMDRLYYSATDIIEMYQDAVYRFLHLREKGISPFDLLDSRPNDDEVLTMAENIEEDTKQMFLISFTELSIALEDYFLGLQELHLLFFKRLICIHLAFQDVNANDIENEFNDSSEKITNILKSFIDEFKAEQLLPTYWNFSFDIIPLPEALFKHVVKEYSPEEYRFIASLWSLDKFSSIMDLIRKKDLIMYGASETAEEQLNTEENSDLASTIIQSEYERSLSISRQEAKAQSYKSAHSDDTSTNVTPKEIRIFISSTFTDMQNERDILLRTINMLRPEAESRGVNLSIIDLRWGITSEESAKGAVIDRCLQEIANCKPFFIGLLGNKYGSAPDKSLTENRELNERYPWLADDINKGLSYTEIEIQSAVLRNPEKIDAYFYLKDNPNSIESHSKLSELKSKIDHQARYPVHHYSEAEQISSHIETVLRNILDKYFPEKNLNYIDMVRKEQHDLLCLRLAFNLDRESLSSKIQTFLDSRTQKVLIIEGDEGSGKSMALARICNEAQHNRKVLYYFADNSRAIDLQDLISYLLEESLEIEKINEKVREAIENCHEPTLIVIDGADIIEPGALRDYILPWISQINDNIKVIVSCRPEAEITKSLLTVHVSEIISPEALTPTERIEFITLYLSTIGKKLTDEQLAILASAEFSSNPGILKSVLDELSSFGYFEKLDSEIRRLSQIKNYDQLARFTLDKLEKEYGKGKVEKIASYLSVVPEGISESDLEELTSLRRLDISLIVGNGQTVFQTRNGIVSVRPASKKVIAEKYLNNKDLELCTRRNVIDFYRAKAEGLIISFVDYDKYRQDFSYNPKAAYVVKTAYQLHALCDVTRLGKLLTDPSAFDILFRTNRTLLNRIWGQLKESGFDFTKMPDIFLSSKLEKHVLPVVINDLGRIARDNGEYALASACHSANLKLLERFSGSSPISMARAAILNNEAITAVNCDNYSQAIDLFRESLEIKQRLMPRLSNEVALGHENLGKALYFNDNDEEAIEHFSEAEEIYRQLEGDESEKTLECRVNKGRSLYYLGKTSEALDTLNEVVNLCIEALGKENPVTLRCFLILAYCWEKISRLLKDEVSLEVYKDYLKQAIICYVKAQKKEDAQKLLDIYNSFY